MARGELCLDALMQRDYAEEEQREPAVCVCISSPSHGHSNSHDDDDDDEGRWGKCNTAASSTLCVSISRLHQQL